MKNKSITLLFRKALFCFFIFVAVISIGRAATVKGENTKPEKNTTTAVTKFYIKFKIPYESGGGNRSLSLKDSCKHVDYVSVKLWVPVAEGGSNSLYKEAYLYNEGGIKNPDEKYPTDSGNNNPEFGIMSADNTNGSFCSITAIIAFNSVEYQKALAGGTGTEAYNDISSDRTFKAKVLIYADHRKGGKGSHVTEASDAYGWTAFRTGDLRPDDYQEICSVSNEKMNVIDCSNIWNLNFNKFIAKSSDTQEEAPKLKVDAAANWFKSFNANTKDSQWLDLKVFGVSSN